VVTKATALEINVIRNGEWAGSCEAVNVFQPALA
jgi:hypothetical protein